MSIEDAESRLRRWLGEETFKGVIFLEADELIGYLLYEDRPVHPDQRSAATVYVRQFFVAREHRRTGFGRAAFEMFVRDLVPSRTSVVLEVKASNPAGQQFWESLGFKAESIAFELDRRKSE